MGLDHHEDQALLAIARHLGREDPVLAAELRAHRLDVTAHPSSTRPPTTLHRPGHRRITGYALAAFSLATVGIAGDNGIVATLTAIAAGIVFAGLWQPK